MSVFDTVLLIVFVALVAGLIGHGSWLTRRITTAEQKLIGSLLGPVNTFTAEEIRMAEARLGESIRSDGESTRAVIVENLDAGIRVALPDGAGTVTFPPAMSPVQVEAWMQVYEGKTKRSATRRAGTRPALAAVPDPEDEVTKLADAVTAKGVRKPPARRTTRKP